MKSRVRRLRSICIHVFKSWHHYLPGRTQDWWVNLLQAPQLKNGDLDSIPTGISRKLNKVHLACVPLGSFVEGLLGNIGHLRNLVLSYSSTHSINPTPLTIRNNCFSENKNYMIKNEENVIRIWFLRMDKYIHGHEKLKRWKLIYEYILDLPCLEVIFVYLFVWCIDWLVGS